MKENKNKRVVGISRIVIVALLALVLVGCAKKGEDIDRSYREDPEILDAIGKSTSGYLIEYNKDGNRSGFYAYNGGKLDYCNIYEFDQNSSTAYCHEGDTKYKRFFTTYDKDGNVLEYNKYDENEVLKSRNVSEYDEWGNKIGYYEYNGEGTLEGRDKYVYDKNGKLLMEYGFRDNVSGGYEDEYISYTYEYDENGNKIVCYGYDMEGNVNRSTTYEYDESGNEIASFYYNGGNLKSYSNREYNESGNPIQFDEYDAEDNLTRCTKREYDEKGREVARHELKDGIMQLSDTYEYDEQDNIIVSYSYDKYGTMKYVNDYDKKGNKITTHSYYGQNELSGYFIYKYDDTNNLIAEYALNY